MRPTHSGAGVTIVLGAHAAIADTLPPAAQAPLINQKLAGGNCEFNPALSAATPGRLRWWPSVTGRPVADVVTATAAFQRCPSPPGGDRSARLSPALRRVPSGPAGNLSADGCLSISLHCAGDKGALSSWIRRYPDHVAHDSHSSEAAVDIDYPEDLLEIGTDTAAITP